MNKFFFHFLESIASDNPILINSIKKGYMACHEAIDDNISELLNDYMYNFMSYKDENPFTYIIENPNTEGVKLFKKIIESNVPKYSDNEKNDIHKMYNYLINASENPVMELIQNINTEESESIENKIISSNEGIAQDADKHLVLKYIIDLLDEPKFIMGMKSDDVTLKKWIEIGNKIAYDKISNIIKVGKL